MPYSNITFTASTGLAFVTNDYVKLSINSSNYIIGQVVSYNSSTGSMTVLPLQFEGSTGPLGGTPFTVTLAALNGTNGTSGISGSTGTTGTSGVSGTSGSSGQTVGGSPVFVSGGGTCSALRCGVSNVASGNYSFVGGSSNTASGVHSASLGVSNTASGNCSFAFGSGLAASISNTTYVNNICSLNNISKFACSVSAPCSNLIMNVNSFYQTNYSTTGGLSYFCLPCAAGYCGIINVLQRANNACGNLRVCICLTDTFINAGNAGTSPFIALSSISFMGDGVNKWYVV
jgi:hypothetical protein